MKGPCVWCRCLHLDWDGDSDTLSSILLQSPDRQVTLHHSARSQHRRNATCAVFGLLDWRLQAVLGNHAGCAGIYQDSSTSRTLLQSNHVMDSCDMQGFDVLLGSDVAYSLKALPFLFKVAASLLSKQPSSVFILGYVSR